MNINEELKKYIENNIFPSYEKNDLGHNLNHIKYVIKRSLKFASMVPDINGDMIYTIAAYHDIGHSIDAKNHEKISSKILLADQNLKNFFTDDQINVMAEAVFDHRASLKGEPRSVYGKIISSADRNTFVDEPLKRTYEYRIKHNPNEPISKIIEESRQHLLNKFGRKGYAVDKIYFEDEDYKQFLKEIKELAENEEKFKERYIKVNHIRKF